MRPARHYLRCPQPEGLRSAEDQDLPVRTHSLTGKAGSARFPSPFIHVKRNNYDHGQ
jgi:hypothetical protein